MARISEEECNRFNKEVFKELVAGNLPELERNMNTQTQKLFLPSRMTKRKSKIRAIMFLSNGIKKI